MAITSAPIPSSAFPGGTGLSVSISGMERLLSMFGLLGQMQKIMKPAMAIASKDYPNYAAATILRPPTIGSRTGKLAGSLGSNVFSDPSKVGFSVYSTSPYFKTHYFGHFKLPIFAAKLTIPTVRISPHRWPLKLTAPGAFVVVHSSTGNPSLKHIFTGVITHRLVSYSKIPARIFQQKWIDLFNWYYAFEMLPNIATEISKVINRP